MNIKRVRSVAHLSSLSYLLIFFFTYLIFVRTDLGQRFDDSAFLGRYEISKEERRDFGTILDLINRSTLILMLLALIVYTFRSRRVLAAIIAALAFAISTIGAELLKRTLPRPEVDFLEEIMKDGGLNTFPSGHSTIATSLVLAILLLSPNKWKAPVVILGTVWVIAITTGTLIAGWHRPSDAIGGITLALAIFGLAAKLKLADTDSPARSATANLSKQIFIIWLTMCSALGASLLAGIQDGLHEAISPWTFPIAALSIITYASYSLYSFTGKFSRVN